MKLQYAVFVVCGVVLLLVPPVWAQVYQQQGNVLDANNRLGSAGLNYGGRVYDPNAANRIVTGNVTGGRAFQGYSPIRDPSALYLGSPQYNSAALAGRGAFSSAYGGSTLPSNRLSAFHRDSYSLLDFRTTPTYGVSMPYYSTTGNVASTGAILGGANRLGSSQLRNPYEDPRMARADRLVNPLSTAYGLSAGGGLAVPSQLVRTNTGQPVTGRVNTGLLHNPLFSGSFSSVSTADLARQASLNQRMITSGQPTGPLTSPVDLRVRSFGPEDPRLTGGQSDGATDRRVRSAVDAILDRAAVQSGFGPNSSLPDQANERAREVSAEIAQRSRLLSGPLTGAEDVYGRMRQLSGNLRQSGPGTVTGGPLLPEADAGTADRQDTAFDSTLGQLNATPLRTFVGTEGSVLNRYLAQAEQYLHEGKYYRAAGLYELARSADPRNPLPPLGKAMSLLAAGDYMSGATALFEAIQLYEPLGFFEVDMKAFVPDLKVLETRRAELEARLEIMDDYRLRFLLGYAEYCSGLEDLGVVDMEKAIDQAPLIVGYTRPGAPPPKPVSRDDVDLQEQVEQLEQTRTADTRRERKPKKDELVARIAAAKNIDRQQAKEKLQELIDEMRDEDAASEQTTTVKPYSSKAIEISSLRRFVEHLRLRQLDHLSPVDAPAAPDKQDKP